MPTKSGLIKLKTIEILSNSTIHGLPNIFKAPNLIRKILWMLLILIFSSFGIYMIIINILDYLEYDVTTKIVVVKEYPTQFPTITFYNLKNYKLNYSLDDILINCNFNDDFCKSTDFEELQDELGNVFYQFNNGRNSTHQKIEIKNSRRSGKANALRVQLFVGINDEKDDSYIHKSLSNYSPSDGFHVIVNNHSYDPQYSSGISYDGIDISIGFETSIIVHRVFTHNLGMPYNNCYKDLTKLDAFNSHLYRFILNSSSYAYTQNDCFGYCLADYMIKKCNLNSNLAKADAIYYWNYNSSCVLPTWYEFFEKDFNERCDRYCPQECDSIDYHLSTSFSRFPNIVYVRELMNNTKILSKFPAGYKITQNDLLNSMIAFNVYYNELSYTKITQLPKTLIIYLVAAIGGLLGLSVGVSCMSFAEIFQLIFEYILIILDYHKNR